MIPPQQTSPQNTKAEINLDSLRNKITPGKLAEQKRKEDERKLRMLLKNALFLEKDEERRKRWLKSIPHLPDDLLHNLIGAVIRENFRYKKGTRNLVIELNKKNVYGQK